VAAVRRPDQPLETPALQEAVLEHLQLVAPFAIDVQQVGNGHVVGVVC